MTEDTSPASPAPKGSDLGRRLVVAFIGVPLILALAFYAPNWALWAFYANRRRRRSLRVRDDDHAVSAGAPGVVGALHDGAPLCCILAGAGLQRSAPRPR